MFCFAFCIFLLFLFAKSFQYFKAQKFALFIKMLIKQLLHNALKSCDGGFSLFGLKKFILLLE